MQLGMSRVFWIGFLVFIQCKWSFAQDPCVESLQRLARYAFLLDNQRVESEDRGFWIAYKMKQGGRLIDLSDPNFDVSQVLTQDPTLVRNPRWDTLRTRYEEAVLSLQPGDTVQYDGKKYLLGSFIGAGNSTHIYRLAQTPESVIRIPFLAEGLIPGHSSLALSEAQKKRGARIFSFLRAFVDRSVGTRNGAVHIDADPEYRYVLAEYVPGNLTGDAFLTRILGPYVSMAQEWYYSPTDNKIHLSADDQKVIDLLIELLKSNGRLEEMRSAETGNPLFVMKFKDVRQYLLDEDKTIWRVVDFN